MSMGTTATSASERGVIQVEPVDVYDGFHRVLKG
jgi:hypothetical protein